MSNVAFRRCVTHLDGFNLLHLGNWIGTDHEISQLFTFVPVFASYIRQIYYIAPYKASYFRMGSGGISIEKIKGVL